MQIKIKRPRNRPVKKLETNPKYNLVLNKPCTSKKSALLWLSRKSRPDHSEAKNKQTNKREREKNQEKDQTRHSRIRDTFTYILNMPAKPCWWNLEAFYEIWCIIIFHITIPIVSSGAVYSSEHIQTSYDQ